MKALVIFIFGAMAVIAVVVLVTWRIRTKRFIQTATVEDVIRSKRFLRNIGKVCDELLQQRVKDTAKAAERKGRLKNHPIEALTDEGVWNDENMQELFLHSVQKTLIGYSQQQRRFIRDVGMMAYNRTIIQYLRIAGIRDMQMAKETRKEG